MHLALEGGIGWDRVYGIGYAGGIAERKERMERMDRRMRSMGDGVAWEGGEGWGRMEGGKRWAESSGSCVERSVRAIETLK